MWYISELTVSWFLFSSYTKEEKEGTGKGVVRLQNEKKKKIKEKTIFYKSDNSATYHGSNSFFRNMKILILCAECSQNNKP
jgi:hypothetical protein